LAIKLANDPKLSDTMAYLETGQTKQEIANVGNELIERSKNYKNLFDPSSGFFRSKDDNNFLSKQNINLATPQGGTFSSEADFDPRRWFCEFTETNA
jgi:putative alpha-1,2-mannosidase